MRVFLIVVFLLPVVNIAGSVNVLSSFYSPDWFPNGLAWDGNYLWLLGGHYDTFYKLSTDGSVISSFTPSEPGGKNGDGAAFDGTNLWGMFIEHTSYPGEVYEYTTSDLLISGNLNWDRFRYFVTPLVQSFHKPGAISFRDN